MVNCQRLTALHPRPTKALFSEVLSNLGILINNHCFSTLLCTRTVDALVEGRGVEGRKGDGKVRSKSVVEVGGVWAIRGDLT